MFRFWHCFVLFFWRAFVFEQKIKPNCWWISKSLNICIHFESNWCDFGMGEKKCLFRTTHSKDIIQRQRFYLRYFYLWHYVAIMSFLLNIFFFVQFINMSNDSTKSLKHYEKKNYNCKLYFVEGYFMIV